MRCSACICVIICEYTYDTLIDRFEAEGVSVSADDYFAVGVSDTYFADDDEACSRMIAVYWSHLTIVTKSVCDDYDDVYQCTQNIDAPTNEPTDKPTPKPTAMPIAVSSANHLQLDYFVNLWFLAMIILMAFNIQCLH